MENFKIEIKSGSINDTVHFHGNIDSHADSHFEELNQRISKKSVVFDFSGAGRINSMGIALLLRSIKSIKTEKQAEISIQGASQINTMLFKMTGIYLLAPEAKRL
ncbi:STAS domain-containing protein [Oryzomonas rubra]|uniref:Anti-sigma factor antagonist n=1 Tax=Oryzomonas rubra TaxID=2509454 RepID=A0A5A9X9F1_9BACT|nr:STAS domain-containing protein [Oryzomonas rubra]KAA0889068.1 anti-sigma factor antagonist [Oryzomonas rubra]